jgi:hypothetical protein
MSEYPNLKGAATTDLVEQVKAGSYSASYINWSRTMQLLRDEAPGWLPELVQTAEGGYVHRGGVGGFLLIRFVHADGTATPGFPQAIMDNRNASIPLDKITSRDITDTHRRGVCMAAALAFGLAYVLWAKMPLESGYADKSAAPSAVGAAETSGAEPAGTGSPNGGEQATPGRESAPGITEAQLSEIAELVPALAKLRDTTVGEVTAALTKDNGPLIELTEAKAEALVGKLRRWKSNLEASAGEPQPGTDGSGSEAPDTPAEKSPFQAPKGARGSKAAA